jgi:hypothetical protein
LGREIIGCDFGHVALVERDVMDRIVSSHALGKRATRCAPLSTRHCRRFNPRAREERDATHFNPLITKPKNPHFREPDLDARAN